MPASRLISTSGPTFDRNARPEEMLGFQVAQHGAAFATNDGLDRDARTTSAAPPQRRWLDFGLTSSRASGRRKRRGNGVRATSAKLARMPATYRSWYARQCIVAPLHAAVAFSNGHAQGICRIRTSGSSGSVITTGPTLPLVSIWMHLPSI